MGPELQFRRTGMTGPAPAVTTPAWACAAARGGQAAHAFTATAQTCHDADSTSIPAAGGTAPPGEGVTHGTRKVRRSAANHPQRRAGVSPAPARSATSQAVPALP